MYEILNIRTVPTRVAVILLICRWLVLSRTNRSFDEKYVYKVLLKSLPPIYVHSAKTIYQSDCDTVVISKENVWFDRD